MQRAELTADNELTKNAATPVFPKENIDKNLASKI